MKTENDVDVTETETETEETSAPKKLLLGKRVLRHFNVRTSIQTGDTKSDDGGTMTLSGPVVTIGGARSYRCTV